MVRAKRRRREHRGQKELHRYKALNRAAIEENEESASAGDAPKTPLTVDLPSSPMNSKEQVQIHPPRNQQTSSHPPPKLRRRTLLEPLEADSYLGVTKDQKKPRVNEAPRSMGPHPH